MRLQLPRYVIGQLVSSMEMSYVASFWAHRREVGSRTGPNMPLLVVSFSSFSRRTFVLCIGISSLPFALPIPLSARRYWNYVSYYLSSCMGRNFPSPFLACLPAIEQAVSHPGFYTSAPPFLHHLPRIYTTASVRPSTRPSASPPVSSHHTCICRARLKNIIRPGRRQRSPATRIPFCPCSKDLPDSGEQGRHFGLSRAVCAVESKTSGERRPKFGIDRGLRWWDFQVRHTMLKAVVMGEHWIDWELPVGLANGVPEL
ncbi:hypothetical protein IWZ00DRAFT_337269 [Phyllosticta capitalensis]